MDRGKFKPLVLKPEPVALACVIVSVALLGLPTWIVWELVAPTTTFPKLALDGVRLIPACVPVPLTEMTEFEPCVVVTVMFPLTFSAAAGLKITFIVCVWPGGSVTGRATPLSVTSFAPTVIWEIVRFEFPLFVSVTLLVLELPALTLPKLRLVGLADSVTLEATPVPLKEIVAGEPGALLFTVIVPDRLPAAVGANTALNVALAPAAKAAGVFRPLTLYPAPLTVS